MPTRYDLLLEQWKLASEVHRHEDTLQWQKFIVFTTLSGGLFLAIGSKWDTIWSGTRQSVALGMIISAIGLVISCTWILTQKRGQWYQRAWIETAKDSERQLLADDSTERVLTLYMKGLEDRFPLSAKKEDRLEILARCSIQQVMTLLAMLSALMWLIFLGAAIRTWAIDYLASLCKCNG